MLKKYILENRQQRDNIIQKLEQLNSVQEAKYDEDFEIYDETGGYAIVLKSTQGDYILRILESIRDTEPNKNWEQFVKHGYSNIVEVIFFKEFGQYYLVLMDKLEPLDSDEREFIRNISLMFNNILTPLPHYISDKGISVSEAIKQNVHDLIGKANRYLLPKIQEIIDNYNKYNDLIEDLDQMLQEYEGEVGSPYGDFHEGNIMKDKQENYKLIDL